MRVPAAESGRGFGGSGVSEGAGRCEGWNVVRHLTADSDIETWVRDGYLLPAVAAAP